MPDFARPACAQRRGSPAVHRALRRRRHGRPGDGWRARPFPSPACSPAMVTVGARTRQHDARPGTGEKIGCGWCSPASGSFWDAAVRLCAQKPSPGSPPRRNSPAGSTRPRRLRSAPVPARRRRLGLADLGRLDLPLMSFRAYVSGADSRLFRAGLIADGALHPRPGDIPRDTSHAWLRSAAPLPPAASRTGPISIMPGAYTWCKAPRLSSRPVEVGSAGTPARRRPAAAAYIALHGGNGRNGGTNVVARVLARAVETRTRRCRRWNAGAACSKPAPLLRAGTAASRGSGIGLIEAARGSLGHWLGIDGGRIRPTRSSRRPRGTSRRGSADGVPGPLEQALIGCGRARRNRAACGAARRALVRSVHGCRSTEIPGH